MDLDPMVQISWMRECRRSVTARNPNPLLKLQNFILFFVDKNFRFFLLPQLFTNKIHNHSRCTYSLISPYFFFPVYLLFQHYALAGLNTCLVLHGQDTTAEYLLDCKIGTSHVVCSKNLSAVRLETTKVRVVFFHLLPQSLYIHHLVHFWFRCEQTLSIAL